MQRCNQDKSNNLGDPALVLLIGKAQGIWAKGLELSQYGPENPEVEVVTSIDPNANKDDKHDWSKARVQVVEGLGKTEKDVTKVHSDKYSNAHKGKVELVGAENEGNGDNVVEYKLLKVPSRFLKLQAKDYGLLSPEGGLKQVECLEKPSVYLVGVVGIEGNSLKIPEWVPFNILCDIHNVKAQ